MSGQYKIGTVTVTNGSAVVVGIGTLWLANISVGDRFKVKNIDTTYEITSVDSDTQITLTVNWAGATLNTQSYNIQVDFTDNCNLQEIWDDDSDWQYRLTLNIREIDRKLKWLQDRVQHAYTTTTTTTSSTMSTTSTTSSTSSTISTTSSSSTASTTSSTSSTVSTSSTASTTSSTASTTSSTTSTTSSTTSTTSSTTTTTTSPP